MLLFRFTEVTECTVANYSIIFLIFILCDIIARLLRPFNHRTIHPGKIYPLKKLFDFFVNRIFCTSIFYLHLIGQRPSLYPPLIGQPMENNYLKFIYINLDAKCSKNTWNNIIIHLLQH